MVNEPAPLKPIENQQYYVRKFALAYSLTTLAFSMYFTPQDFHWKPAVIVNALLFLIGAPYWFRNTRLTPYALNVTSQLANAGASVWICSFLGPTSHVNLVAIPQFIMALMMFRDRHPRTTWAAAALCLWLLSLPLYSFVNTWHLDKRMPEDALRVLRAIMDLTIFALSTYQFRIISEAWSKLLGQAEQEKRIYQHRNEWRKKLLRILSHDIKEPMVHSLVAARNLKKKVGGEESSIVNQIESAQISIKEMISNVELSNQELDAPEARSVLTGGTSHTISGVLQKLGPWFESRLTEKQVVLDTQGASPEHTLTAASDAFVYQVFMNLLSNAVKFSPTGSQVRISSQSGQAGETLWVIEDQGGGIHPDAFSAHPMPQPGTAGERGSGLGLKIARSFAEDHGIEIHWLSPHVPTRYPGIDRPSQGTRVVLAQRAASSP